MTPVEVFEYKQKWLPGVQVTIHSDQRRGAVDWCKSWMNPIHWKHREWSGAYEDTFHFKTLQQAKGLVEQFPNYAKLVETTQ